MVSATRSTRKSTDENSVKNRLVNGKSDGSGSKKSLKEASSSKDENSSPQSTRKSERCEKSITPSSRKSERLEKLNPPSPLDRQKKNILDSSGKKQPAKERGPLDLKGKKEKNLMQLTMEAEKVVLDQGPIQRKRKRRGRDFKAIFKIQRIEESVLDVDGKLEEPNKSSNLCNGASGGISSKPIEKGADSNFKEFDTNSSVRESFDDCEKLLSNSSPTKSIDDPEPAISLQNGPINSDNQTMINCDEDGFVAVPVNCSPSAKDENSSLFGNSVMCNKKKRLGCDSPEQELCSRDTTVGEEKSSFPTSKDNDENGAAVNLESAEKCADPLKEGYADSQIDCLEDMCVVCNKNGELVCCEGVDCKGTYHLSCLDPPLTEFPPGWRCPKCVKKKLPLGVHCVSKVVESKFLEYWVPVEISNIQLEQYCDALISNSISLRSSSRSDPVGALREILITTRKCCDHPYLVDSSILQALYKEGRLAPDIMEIGIKTSGKLHLLDLMLSEIKSRQLKVLILYQLIQGPGKSSTGNILEDFLCHRFGENTYERVDSMVSSSKFQPAVTRFNKKESRQFVLLLENRACSSTIKLSNLDLIIIYDSEWNPAHDLKSLQKISIDSKLDPIKVFRLYSSCTVEERALLLAKQNLNLDNTLHNMSRSTSDALLMWGASHLFEKLDEYHADRNFTGSSNMHEIISKEFAGIISGNCDSNSFISKVKLDVGSYNINIPMLGESKIQLKNGVEPHVFWKNLLDRKVPNWKHLKGSNMQRNRKRVQYFDDGVAKKSDQEKDDAAKKCKRVVNGKTTEHHQVAHSTGYGEGPSTIVAGNKSQSLQKDSLISDNRPIQNSIGGEVGTNESEKRFLSPEQTSLHSFLQEETTKLCQILKLSEDITSTVRKFLGYVIKNTAVSSDSPPIMHAFQLSLCWTAASILKQKVDKKDSFNLAQGKLNYQCTEDQVNSVSLKMRSLKKRYLQSLINTDDEENINKEPSNVNNDELPLFSPENVKIEVQEKSLDSEHTLLLKKLETVVKDAGAEKNEKINEFQRKCVKRMKKLFKKQEKEVHELKRIWNEKRAKLEKDHKLDSAFNRTIYNEGPVRTEKLKLLDDDFAKKMKDHDLLKELEVKNLKEKQLAYRIKESQQAVDWLAEAIAYSSENSTTNLPVSEENGEIRLVETDIEVPIEVSGIVPEESAGPDEPTNGVLSFPEEAVVGPNEPTNGGLSFPEEVVGPNAPTNGGLSFPEESTVRSEQTLVSSDVPPQDEIHTTELPDQNQNAPVVETEITPQIEISTSELVQTSTLSQHIHEPHITLNSDQPNQSPAVDNVCQNLNRETSIESHSQSGRNLEPHHPSQEPASGGNAPVNSSGLTQILNHQPILQPAIDVGHLHRPSPSRMVHPTPQIGSWNSTHSLASDPLQIDLERLRKENELLDKTHEHMVSRWKSDCEKETQEAIAQVTTLITTQVRNKYEAKIKNDEAEYRRKKDEVAKKQKRFYMSKALAEASRLKWSDVRFSRQAVPSSSVQHMHQPRVGLPTRLPSGTVNQQISAPAPRPNPMRTSFVPNQNVTLTPLVSVQNAAGNANQQISAPSPLPIPMRTSFVSNQNVTNQPLVSVQNAVSAPSPPHIPTRTSFVPNQNVTIPPLVSVQNATVTANQQISAPAPLPIPMRTSFVPNQNVTVPPIVSTQNAVFLISGGTTSCRPPIGREFRSQAPHLQRIRPAGAPPLPPTNLVSQSRPEVQSRVPPPDPVNPSAPHLQPFRPAGEPPLPPPQPPTNLVTQSKSVIQNEVPPPAPVNPSLSNGPCLPAHQNYSFLPAVDSTFNSLEPSDLENIGSSMQGNQPCALASAVVCLSDDE